MISKSQCPCRNGMCKIETYCHVLYIIADAHFCLLKVAKLVSSTSSGGFQALYSVCIVCAQAQTSFSASLGTDVAAFCSVCSRLHADANCDDIQRLAVHKRRFWSFVGLLYLQLQAVTVC